ncbi:hypothetical protein DSECCO2_221260 [anaerobic digester metagenome]
MDAIINWFLDPNNNVKIVVAIIAFVGVICTIIANFMLGKSNIKANVVSQARVKWIQDIKGFLSEYISIALNMKHYISVWKSDKENKDKSNDDFKYYNDKVARFQTLQQLLILNLGPETIKDEFNNEDFIKRINQVAKNVDFVIKTYDGAEDKRDDEEFEKCINCLSNYGRNYFKKACK